MSDKKASKKKCFVASVISSTDSVRRNHADWLLEYIIRPVFSEHFPEYEQPFRSDKIAVPGAVDTQVITHLLDDELVIADMTFANPNVFYEMGIRHMTGKAIIHMVDLSHDIPFDVSHYRAIPYSVINPKAIEAAKVDLNEQISEVERAGYEAENPVTMALGSIKLKATATPSERVLIAEMDEMKARLGQLEGGRASPSTVITGHSSGRLGDIVVTPTTRRPTSLPLAITARFATKLAPGNTLELIEEIQGLISDGYFVGSPIEFQKNGVEITLPTGATFDRVKEFADQLVGIDGILSVEGPGYAIQRVD